MDSEEIEELLLTMDEEIFSFSEKQKIEALSILLWKRNTWQMTCTDYQELESLLKSYENRII